MDTRGPKNTLFSCVTFIAALLCASAHADDCIRSKPFPIFASDHNRVKAHRFDLKSENEAIEEFEFASGIRVRVMHGGCEYFVTSFRFEARELFAKGYSVAEVYKTAASLLTKLNGLRPESTFDLRLASATLLRKSTQKQKLTLDQQVEIRGDGISPLEAKIRIDSAGRGRSGGYLELTLFRGPL